MKQILVPLDGSAVAEAIVPHARVWAQTIDASLLLLQVIRAPRVDDPLTGLVSDPDTNPYPVWEAQREQARTYLDTVAAHLAAEQVPVETAIREGDPATIITASASATPDIVGIAMCTHGRSGLDRVIFGSVAEAVMHAVPKPLLVLGHRPPHDDTIPAGPYRTILVPLDGSPAAEVALRQAQLLAAPTNAILVLVTVAPAPNDALTELSWAVATAPPIDRGYEDYMTRVAQRVESAGTKVQTRITRGRRAATIRQCATQAGANLIVMVTHRRAGLERFVYGSVSIQVVQGAVCPVLLIPA
jgi:nucleotide-binding universal stress UspA family protein